MESYGRRLRKAAREDFKSFWSAHRLWATLANAIAPLVMIGILAALRIGGSMISVPWIVTIAVVSFVISLVGNYVIAMWRGAKTMDAVLHVTVQSKCAEIEQHRDTNKKLETRLATPPVSPLEKSKRDLVQEKLKQFSLEGLEAIRYVLKHGEVDAGGLTTRAIPGADFSVQLELEKAVVQAYDSELFKTGGFVPGGMLTRVNPDLRDALSFHLLPHE